RMAASSVEVGAESVPCDCSCPRPIFRRHRTTMAACDRHCFNRNTTSYLLWRSAAPGVERLFVGWEAKRKNLAEGWSILAQSHSEVKASIETERVFAEHVLQQGTAPRQPSSYIEKSNSSAW